MTKPLKAPFPWFGGKSKAADNKNRYQEALWFSPHCLQKEEIKQEELFA